MTEAAATTPRPAATLIICREIAPGTPPELLLAERTEAMRFAGGAAVFPGGQVDQGDLAMARASQALTPDSSETDGEGTADLAARIAAIRETLEETGLAVAIDGAQRGSVETIGSARSELMQSEDLASVLHEYDWQIAPDQLVPFARWLPLGLGHSHIFDTRFYLANIGAGECDPTPDGEENQRLFWMSANAALDAADRREIKIIFPTRRNLERLAQFASFDEMRRHAEATRIQTITPWIAEHDGRKWLTIPDDAGYPVCREELSSAARG